MSSEEPTQNQTNLECFPEPEKTQKSRSSILSLFKIITRNKTKKNTTKRRRKSNMESQTRMKQFLP